VQVITKSRAEQRPVWQVEQEIFGSTHADVGAYLLTLWGLADPITEAVALHHQPFRCAVPEFSPTVAVHVANVFAHELAGTDLTGPRPQLDIAYLTSLGLAGRIDAWRESCRDSIKL
jgi:HD-like signal output (HDOD) protein